LLYLLPLGALELQLVLQEKAKLVGGGVNDVFKTPLLYHFRSIKEFCTITFAHE
jgi:hypothetical protein